MAACFRCLGASGSCPRCAGTGTDPSPADERIFPLPDLGYADPAGPPVVVPAEWLADYQREVNNP